VEISQLLQKTLQRPSLVLAQLFVLRRPLGLREQLFQKWSDPLELDDHIDRVGGQSAGHAAELGGLGVLDDHGAARLLHGAGPPGPVRARA
jgi:hypothetical protein